jgi:hypothetical protein
MPAMDAVIFRPEPSIRRALILALDTYGATGLSSAEREPLTAFFGAGRITADRRVSARRGTGAPSSWFTTNDFRLARTLR